MDINLLTMMDNLSLAVLSSLDFLVIAVCFSADSNLDILPIQRLRIWFDLVALLWSIYLIFCRELLFVCNQKFRHSRRRAARGVLASFSWGSFSIFFSIFGLVARAFHSTFSTSAANLMQEAITGATATIIYGLRIKPDSYSV